MTHIAIIGTGLSGLSLAQQLPSTVRISLFEKSDIPGGRLANRQRDGFSFDHGAQFFTVKTAAFRRFLTPFINNGTVKRWDARFAEFVGPEIQRFRQWDAEFPHYVGAPDMNALPRTMATDLDIHYHSQVTALQRHQQQWQLIIDHKPFNTLFDWVIIALPAAQTAALLPTDFNHYKTVSNTQMQACYALMLGFNERIENDWQAALVHDADISWMSVNSSKPGRNPAQTSMVAHARNQYADQNLNTDIQQIRQHLQQEVARVSGIDTGKAAFFDCKRWHYANLPPQHGEHKAYLDTHLQLGVCGDWCIQGRVEAAFSSAHALASQLADLL